MFRKRKGKSNKSLLIPYNEQDRAKMEEIGFIFRGKLDEDYMYVDLPSGWIYTKHVDEGSLYVYLYDSKNRFRAEFTLGSGGHRFKWYCRYRICYDKYKDGYLWFSRYVVVDSYDNNDTPYFIYNDHKNMQKFVIRSTAPTARTPNKDEIIGWLVANYPDYENPFAYWDEDISE